MHDCTRREFRKVSALRISLKAWLQSTGENWIMLFCCMWKPLARDAWWMPWHVRPGGCPGTLGLVDRPGTLGLVEALARGVWWKPGTRYPADTDTQTPGGYTWQRVLWRMLDMFTFGKRCLFKTLAKCLACDQQKPWYWDVQEMPWANMSSRLHVKRCLVMRSGKRLGLTHWLYSHVRLKPASDAQHKPANMPGTSPPTIPGRSPPTMPGRSPQAMSSWSICLRTHDSLLFYSFSFTDTIQTRQGPPSPIAIDHPPWPCCSLACIQGIMMTLTLLLESVFAYAIE